MRTRSETETALSERETDSRVPAMETTPWRRVLPGEPTAGVAPSGARTASRRRMHRVLLLVENNPYPADFRVRREALALRDAGYQVRVIAPRATGQRWHEVVDGVDVRRFPAVHGARGLAGYALEFGWATSAMLVLSAWVAVSEGFDVIHAANPPDTLWLIAAVFKLAGKRFVYDHHDLAPETYLSRFGVRRRNAPYRVLCLLERCSHAVADVVICTNESYRRVALCRGRKSDRQVYVVRNGPPMAFGQGADLKEPDDGVHRIGYVGTIGPQDGVDHWMRAVGHMVHTFKRRDFLAVVIGDGDSLSDVKRLAGELGIEGHVLFTGRLPEAEVRRELSRTQLCVQPDPLSPLNDVSTMNKLMEYMALGKPTVAFDLVETRFSGEDAAVYVQPNDDREFARQVCLLLDDPSRRSRMGERGRQRVEAALAWEHSVPSLLRAYGALKP